MKHQSLKIGITGGIGSGKTTVCKIFETLSVPVYYADDRAKFLMTNDVSLKAKITALFGGESFNGGKELNRAYIANIVFNDTHRLEALNALVHPVVTSDYERWHAMHHHALYTIKEAALLYESERANTLDKIIMVYAPLPLRIKRVMARDNASEAAVRCRVEKQMDDEQKRKLADFEILNDEKHSLIQQVLRVHHQILQSCTA